MEKETAVAPLPALIIALILILFGWLFILPQVCRFAPVQLPGSGFDWCWFVQ
jgi:hypothetical protein